MPKTVGSFVSRLLDRSVVFDFDRTGFERHARRFDDTPERDLGGRRSGLRGNSTVVFEAGQHCVSRRFQYLRCRRKLYRDFLVRILEQFINRLMHDPAFGKTQFAGDEINRLNGVDNHLDDRRVNGGSGPDVLDRSFNIYVAHRD